MAAHAFHVIVLAPLIHTPLHVKSHIYLTHRQLTYSHITVHTCYSSCVNANSIFSCTFTFIFLSALKFISAFHCSTIFECISISFCLFFFSFPSFPFHVSLVWTSACSLWTCSFIVGALQSGAWWTFTLTALHPRVWRQFGHRGEDDTSLLPAWDAHH